MTGSYLQLLFIDTECNVLEVMPNVATRPRPPPTPLSVVAVELTQHWEMCVTNCQKQSSEQ